MVNTTAEQFALPSRDTGPNACRSSRPLPLRLQTKPAARLTSGAFAQAVAGFCKTMRSVVGASSSERIGQLVGDTVLARILIDRGAIDDVLAARAAADRDHTGLLFEHVLHAKHGVPLDELLGALAERRAIMGNEAV